MICTFQLTPVTPIPLLPTAPISPAVNVPWPFPSIGLLLLSTKFQPIRSSGRRRVAVLGANRWPSRRRSSRRARPSR